MGRAKKKQCSPDTICSTGTRAGQVDLATTLCDLIDRERIEAACCFMRVLPAPELHQVVNQASRVTKLSPLLAAIRLSAPAYALTMSRVNTTHIDDLVALLLASKPDVNRIGSTGVTPLGFCAQLNCGWMAVSLLVLGATADKPSSTHMTPGKLRLAGPLPPLHLAALHNATQVLQVLVDAGVPVDSLDREGHSALWWSVRGQSLEALKKLCALGADVHAGARSRLPLVLAVRMGFYRLTSALLENGAGLGREQQLNELAMHSLAMGNPDVFHSLLEAGASCHVREPSTDRNLWHILADSFAGWSLSPEDAFAFVTTLSDHYFDVGVLEMDKKVGKSCAPCVVGGPCLFSTRVQNAGLSALTLFA